MGYYCEGCGAAVPTTVENGEHAGEADCRAACGACVTRLSTHTAMPPQWFSAGLFYRDGSTVDSGMKAHVVGKVPRVSSAPIASAEYDDAEFYDTKVDGLVKCPACLGDGGGCQFTCGPCFFKVYHNRAIQGAIKPACDHASERAARALIYAEFGAKLRAQPTTQASTPAPRIERPCKACKRPNDVGVRSCWCCGIESPV